MLRIGSHVFCVTPRAARGRPAAAERTITIGIDDTMKYSVTSIAAKPGERLRIVLTSTGTMPKLAMAHNFVLLPLGMKGTLTVR